MTTGPTDESARKALFRAQEYLDNSGDMLKPGGFSTAIDRSYYFIHSAIALLLSRGVETPKSHRGLISLFGSEIVRTGAMDREFGRILANANDRRMRFTYDLDAEASEEVAWSAVDNPRSFFAAARAAIES